MLLDESCGVGTCGVLLKAGRAMEASNLTSLKQVRQRRLLHRHAARRRHHNGSRRLRRLRREALRAARRHVRCLFPMRQRLLSACPVPRLRQYCALGRVYHTQWKSTTNPHLRSEFRSAACTSERVALFETCSTLHAGKSAGLILRRIHAPVLAEARALELERLAATASRWSLRDAPLPPPAPPPAVPLPPPGRRAPKRCTSAAQSASSWVSVLILDRCRCYLY